MKILFVCRGNVFRSFLATYYLNKKIQSARIENIVVDSAGIEAKEYAGQKAYEALVAFYKQKNINVISHVPKKVSSSLLKKFDVVVAFDTSIQKYLEDNFNCYSILFNDLSFDKNTSIKNLQNKNSFERITQKIELGAENIFRKIDFLQSTTCLLCKFSTKLVQKHRKNGFPLRVISETKHSISFLSEDISKKIGPHILVVPKKHFETFETLDDVVMIDIMRHISSLGKVIMKKFGAYNLIQNNGRNAEQTIPHVHFHLFPRIKGDSMKIEVWERDYDYSTEDYLEFHNMVLKLLKTQ